MSFFYRQRAGWEFPRAVLGKGALIWDADGDDDLAVPGPPLVIEREQVSTLGDAISAATRGR